MSWPLKANSKKNSKISLLDNLKFLIDFVVASEKYIFLLLNKYDVWTKNTHLNMKFLAFSKETGKYIYLRNAVSLSLLFNLYTLL